MLLGSIWEFATSLCMDYISFLSYLHGVLCASTVKVSHICNDMGTVPWCYLVEIKEYASSKHCVKSVHIQSSSGPHFPAFGLNTETYSESLRIRSKCGKMPTRITPNLSHFPYKDITPVQPFRNENDMRYDIWCRPVMDEIYKEAE